MVVTVIPIYCLNDKYIVISKPLCIQNFDFRKKISVFTSVCKYGQLGDEVPEDLCPGPGLGVLQPSDVGGHQEVLDQTKHELSD